jgi:hypothetical protein
VGPALIESFFLFFNFFFQNKNMNKQSETKNSHKQFKIIFTFISRHNTTFFVFNKKKNSDNLNLEMYKETELKEKLELT